MCKKKVWKYAVTRKISGRLSGVFHKIRKDTFGYHSLCGINIVSKDRFFKDKPPKKRMCGRCKRSRNG